MKTSTYTPQYDELRAWLKAKRDESGLSLRELGAVLGCHHSIIGKLEQDRRRIDIFEFIDYCEAVGADPHEGINLLIKESAAKA